MDPFAYPYFEAIYIVAFAVCVWVLNGMTCAVIASQRNRSKVGWFLLGAIFGPWSIAWAFAMKPLPTAAEQARLAAIRKTLQPAQPGIPPGLHEEMPPVSGSDEWTEPDGPRR